ncbi:cobalt-precorrin-6A reductase [Methylosinus sp. H3A]|uniref:cobalt-precorrin-6A reductase n=1 Tax=Methylosinus sp. H3A TaxID=2785786 RepID=UPI0018C2EF59|nr:cobalt-precorrin-6A reductase [Methylosinus sp. H3A]MBG0811090.1 cobalt-precorrin-6A reductase [Methylosinus sp. H3A]
MPQTKTPAAGPLAAPRQKADPIRALILGGTSEARALAARVAGDARLYAVVSLAGRTSAPLASPLPTRIGGFGGVEGLKRYLTEERVDRVIDATHPFAARMSANARAACAALGLPLLVYTRAPWSPVEGDRWIEVEDNAGAVAALGEAPRRVFLTIGRLGLADFLCAPQHYYLIRTIDQPPENDLPPRYDLILERGPFAVESELSLMRETKIDRVVSKNSGGRETYAKIEAARALGLDVVMVTPPRGGDARVVHDVEAAVAFLFGEGR